MEAIKDYLANNNNNMYHSSQDSEGSDDSFDNNIKLGISNVNLFNEKNLNQNEVHERKKMFEKLTSHLKISRNNNNFIDNKKQKKYKEKEDKELEIESNTNKKKYVNSINTLILINILK